MSKRDPIQSVMTSHPTYVQRSQPISQVYDLLDGAPYHHVPVLDGDRPVGMVSASDILRLVYDIDGSDDRMLRTMLDHQFNIDDAMTEELRTLPTTASVYDAATTLSDGSLHSVLVVDDDGKLAGIVTSTDLVRYLRDNCTP
ncbi:MAG: HPP family protein [Acidimicrobiales bacterium]